MEAQTRPLTVKYRRPGWRTKVDDVINCCIHPPRVAEIVATRVRYEILWGRLKDGDVFAPGDHADGHPFIEMESP